MQARPEAHRSVPGFFAGGTAEEATFYAETQLICREFRNLKRMESWM